MTHYDSGDGDLRYGVSDNIVLRARNEDIGRLRLSHVSRGPVVTSAAIGYDR